MKQIRDAQQCLPSIDVLYHALQSTDEPLASIHFKGEGDVEFRSILFIPPKAPPGILDNYYNQKSGLDLYVRRVFITNNFDELVPRYDPSYISWLKSHTLLVDWKDHAKVANIMNS